MHNATTTDAHVFVPPLQDEFYNRYLVKNHLMAPVVAAFVGEAGRRMCTPCLQTLGGVCQR